MKDLFSLFCATALTLVGYIFSVACEEDERISWALFVLGFVLGAIVLVYEPTSLDDYSYPYVYMDVN